MTACLGLQATLGGCAGDGQIDQWQKMAERERSLLNDRKMNDALCAFLEQFNEDCGKTLYDMALSVDQKVDFAIRYESDGKTWGASEYWASPAEIVARQAGDCEDFAILKYAVLCHLGVDPERLRVMTVGRTSLGLNHAILVIDMRPNDLCAALPLSQALSEQKGLDGIYIVENDGYGTVMPLTGSGFYAFGIMNKYEQKPLRVSGAFRQSP